MRQGAALGAATPTLLSTPGWAPDKEAAANSASALVLVASGSAPSGAALRSACGSAESLRETCQRLTRGANNLFNRT